MLSSKKWRTIISWEHKKTSTSRSTRERKGRLNHRPTTNYSRPHYYYYNSPSREKRKLRHAPQKEGGWKILGDLLPVWPRLVRPTNLMSRMNGKKTQNTKHTHTGNSTDFLDYFLEIAVTLHWYMVHSIDVFARIRSFVWAVAEPNRRGGGSESKISGLVL